MRKRLEKDSAFESARGYLSYLRPKEKKKMKRESTGTVIYSESNKVQYIYLRVHGCTVSQGELFAKWGM